MIGKTPVIDISGPPGGAAFTTDFYLYPAIMAFLGREPGLLKRKARPLAQMKPGPVEAEKADAYYLLPVGNGAAAPKKGDFIDVWLRPVAHEMERLVRV